MISHFWPRPNPAYALFIQRRDGAQHMLAGRRAAKLRKELLAGRGGPEITSLVENGYVGFLGTVRGETGIFDFEALRPEHFT